jgi:creatinine amidohydrolase/Fe(II)-dependent formamide hydrolase-like protein
MPAPDFRSLTRIALMGALLGAAGAATAGAIHHVAEMNTRQIDALPRDRTVVILPGGILEEHGPYLPSQSDGYMNERMTQELAQAIAARPGWEVLVFPMIPIGAGGANEIGRDHSWSGTYAVRSTTLRAVFMDLATELGDQGFRWVFVVHAHGAPHHNHALDVAGDYFHDNWGGHMVNLYGQLVEREDVRTEEERRADGRSQHGGMVESSVLMHLRPDLVAADIAQAPDFVGPDFAALIRISETEGWTGYYGAPRLANPEFGARAWRAMSAPRIAHALRILDGFDYRQTPRLGDIPDPAIRSVVDATSKHDEALERRQQEWLRAHGHLE